MVQRCRADPSRLLKIVLRALHGLSTEREATLVGPQDGSRRYGQHQMIDSCGPERVFGAIGVGAYIALAGLWGSPIPGASMNPARTFGPNLVGTDSSYWVYVAGPLAGAMLAVGAEVLRGLGGGRARSAAAQGDLYTEIEHPDKA